MVLNLAVVVVVVLVVVAVVVVEVVVGVVLENNSETEPVKKSCVMFHVAATNSTSALLRACQPHATQVRNHFPAHQTPPPPSHTST